MATPKIYIGSYNVAGGWAAGQEHLYILYDPDQDGNNTPETYTAGNEPKILRGGPEFLLSSGQVSISIMDENDSPDSFDGDSAADRHFRDIITGYNATSVWNSVVALAQTMGTWDASQNQYETNIDYTLLGTNSNSVINTVLNVMGLKPRIYTPINDNGIGYKPAWAFPGHMSLLDGGGDSIFTAYIYDGLLTETTNFYKRDGNDYVILQWDHINNEHARLYVENTNSSEGLTTIYMDGLNYEDVTFDTSFTDPHDLWSRGEYGAC